MTYSPNENDRLWRDSEDDSWFHFGGPFRFIVLVIILIGLILGGWYYFSPKESINNKNSIPLVRADEAPTKIKAEDQGVPTVKHQDKLVYGRIREDKNTSTVEHILPDPETPLAQVNQETVKMVEQYQPEDLDIEKVSTPEMDSPKITSIEDLIEVDTPAEKVEKVVVKQEAPKEKKKIVKGTVFIQLGSLKSYDIAESEWARLSKKHSDVLGGYKPTIQKVDLGAEKGIYYRLRTGPFESQESASQSCSTLKERKVECLVIR